MIGNLNLVRSYIIFSPQAVKENTRENEILKQAPFLIPYPIRVKIFNVRILTSSDVDYVCVIDLK
jgi:hypothetical protein